MRRVALIRIHHEIYRSIKRKQLCIGKIVSREYGTLHDNTVRVFPILQVRADFSEDLPVRWAEKLMA